MSKPTDLLKLSDVPSLLALLRYPDLPGEQDLIVPSVKRLDAENSYKSLLNRAILEGHLLQRDHAGIPISRHRQVWYGGYVLRVGLQRMLDIYSVPIQLDGPSEIESMSSTNKLRRRDILWPAIETAIRRAASLDVAAVWVELKELAISGQALPFTGIAKDGALEYTNADDKVKQFTRESLRKRLSRLKNGGL